MSKNLDNAIKIIGQAIFDFFPDRGEKDECLKQEDREANEGVNRLLTLASEAYVLVGWPESQEYMEEEWFEDEAVLDVNNDNGSSYFIPLKYLI